MIAIIKRDLLLAFRNLNEIVNPVLFFIIVAALFPMAIGPESKTLSLIAPGIIWVAALLSTLLSLDMMFRADFADGSLEQIRLSPQPFAVFVLGKIIAHWVIAGIPLIIASPLLSVLLFLPEKAHLTMVISLILGTPTLSLVGAIGMGLTVGLKRSGILLSLLVLPLYIPVLIIGTMAIHDVSADLPVTSYLLVMAAIMVLALTFAPIAAAAAIKISME